MICFILSQLHRKYLIRSISGIGRLWLDEQSRQSNAPNGQPGDGIAMKKKKSIFGMNSDSVLEVLFLFSMKEWMSLFLFSFFWFFFLISWFHLVFLHLLSVAVKMPAKSVWWAVWLEPRLLLWRLQIWGLRCRRHTVQTNSHGNSGFGTPFSVCPRGPWLPHGSPPAPSWHRSGSYPSNWQEKTQQAWTQHKVGGCFGNLARKDEWTAHLIHAPCEGSGIGKKCLKYESVYSFQC